MFALAQFDNMFPDFLEVRNKVIEGGFSTEIGPDGFPYTGIGSSQPADHWPKIVEQAIGHEIIPRLSCFRLNLSGEMPHSFVHSDDICAKYASVTYMNLPEQCKGGTTFWQTNGLEYMPSDEELTKAGINPLDYGTEMTKAWKNKNLWSPASFIGMKSNRFITYPCSRFHSRWPWEGWGSGPEDGRMIWALFYDFNE